MTDYPFGDGFDDCPTCYGRGVVNVTMPGLIVPATKPCPCVEHRDRLNNMQKRWAGLGSTHPVAETHLGDEIKNNIRITASRYTLKAHLHRIALSQPPDWDFSIESDRELAKAWLYTARIVGDAYDPDVALTEPKHQSLEDLSDYSSLLIVFLGVKAARNSASPELLVDVVQGRSFHNKPTWVVDEPHNPLAPGHLSYSDNALILFQDWDHFRLRTIHREAKVVEEVDYDLDRTDPLPGVEMVKAPRIQRAPVRPTGRGSDAEQPPEGMTPELQRYWELENKPDKRSSASKFKGRKS